MRTLGIMTLQPKKQEPEKKSAGQVLEETEKESQIQKKKTKKISKKNLASSPIEKGDWPQIILVRKASNGRTITKTWRAPRIEIQKESHSIVQAKGSASEHDIHITMQNSEEVE